MNYHLGNLQDFNPDLCQQLKRYCYEINGCCQTVHKELGPFLNEYMYQDALEIIFNERAIPHTREYYFSVDFHGQQIRHNMFVERSSSNVKQLLLLVQNSVSNSGTT